MSKYYVYVLRDAEGEPFYVGKGSGRRALDHIFGRSPASGGGAEKQAIIERSRAERSPLHIEIAGWFDDVREAFEFEARLIERHGAARVEGKRLTNKASGGQVVSVGFPADLHETASAKAAEWGVTVQALVVHAVRELVEKRAA